MRQYAGLRTRSEEIAMPEITVSSPLGPITLVEAGGCITRLDWAGRLRGQETALLREARRQLQAYFAGRLRAFDLPLSLAGSPFQQRVWQAMQRIPYGETRSYGELAHETDSGPRAVGYACGTNPIAIIVPCHRVLAAGKRIGGYSGGAGIATKRLLLEMEKAPVVTPRERLRVTKSASVGAI
jgi:methylated-DNA-[protein]-cysteine S-methyltransferase